MTDLLIFPLNPVAPPLLALLGCAILLVLSANSYWRLRHDHAAAAGGLFLARCLFIVGLFVLLMNPVLRSSAADDESKALLWIMFDTSRSMRTSDIEGRPRIAAAVEGLVDSPVAEALRERYDVRWYAVGERMLPMTRTDVARAIDHPDEAGDESILESQLSEAVMRMRAAADREGAPGEIIVVSDGRDTHGGSLQQVGSRAREMGVKLHALALGQPRLQRDVAISAAPLQPNVLPGETAAIAATINHVGFDGRSIVVRLVEQKENSITIHDQRAVALDDSQKSIQLQMQPSSAGSHILRVETQPFNDEPVAGNNTQPVVVQVRPKAARLLMLEGRPDFDSRALAQAIRGDDRFSLTQIIRLTPTKMQVIAPGDDPAQGRALELLPDTPEGFSQYDLVILSDQADRLLDAMSAVALVQYVENGGAVLFADAANAATNRSASVPLRRLQPAEIVGPAVSLNQGRLVVTPSGARHPSLSSVVDSPVGNRTLQSERWPTMPRLTPAEAKPGATALLNLTVQESGRTTQHPAVVTMPVGRGRVIAMYGHDWWRWRLRPPAQADQRQWHDTFWQEVARWLVSGEQVGRRMTLRAQPSVVRVGQPVEVEATYRWVPGRQSPPVATATHIAGRVQQITMQPRAGVSATYHATFIPTEPGAFEVTATTPSGELRSSRIVVATEDVTEQLQASPDRQAMQQMADASLGRFVAVETTEDFADVLNELDLAPAAPARSASSKSESAGLTWWVMAAGLVLLCGEWLIRRRYGWT